ncbi:MAG: tetratricopeptide repeat protein [Candidatus Omnitrophota bacterium]|nr:MAG: tetratricopeptide repeat protein [Candidatus Omnitrophota bacterium]
MKTIILTLTLFFCINPLLDAAPKRENGLSVHLSPESAPGIFGVDKKGFMVSQSKSLKPLRERPLFDTPEQLIEYFLNQSQEIQENGLWVVTTNPKAYSDDEMKSTEILKNLCRKKNIILFFCRGMWLPDGWIRADKFNLKDSDNIYSNMIKANKIESDAIAHAQQGNYDKAIELYNKALNITLNPAYVIHDRGMAYAEKGEYSKCIDDITKAMELNPNEIEFIAQCYNDRGVAYFHSGQYEKSWQDVQKALDMNYNVHPGFLAALKSKGYSK